MKYTFKEHYWWLKKSIEFKKRLKLKNYNYHILWRLNNLLLDIMGKL